MVRNATTNLRTTNNKLPISYHLTYLQENEQNKTDWNLTLLKTIPETNEELTHQFRLDVTSLSSNAFHRVNDRKERQEDQITPPYDRIAQQIYPVRRSGKELTLKNNKRN